MDRKRQNRLLLILVLLSSLPFFLVRHLPFQDIPDWTLQASILNHLDDGRFSQHYALQWVPVPNLIGTLLIAGIGKAAGEIFAAKIVAFLCVFLFAFGFVYLRRADGRLTPHLEILGVLFATNHFLMMGYFNFLLGLALAFFGIGYYWRRAAFLAVESAIVLGGLMLLIYFAHFIAFFIAVTSVFFISWRTYFRQWKRYIAPALALAPGLILALIYAAGRQGECVIGFFYNPFNYVWYKVAPLMALSNFNPVTPPAVAWVVLLLNVSILLILAALVGWLIARKAVDFRSPMTLAALFLFVLGLVSPTGICGLIRPGQRLMFAALFLFLAGVDAPRELRKEVRASLALAVAALLIIGGVNLFSAGRLLDDEIEVLERRLPGDASLCMINDSNFDMGSRPELLAKMTDPLSYPAWVSPLKAAGYYHFRDHGGFLGTLFPYGLLQAQGKALPKVHSIEHLADAERMSGYSHVLISGKPNHVQALVQAASHSFVPIRKDVYFALLKRRPPVSPMDIGPLYYLWMPGP